MPSTPPKSRTLVPISVKLILATAAILGAITAASAYLSRRVIGDLAEEYAESRRRSGEAEIQHQAEMLALNTATSAALPLAEGNYTYVSSLVESTALQEARVLWLLIADLQTDRIVARSAGAPEVERLADELVEPVRAAGGGQVIAKRDPDDPSSILFGAQIVAGDRPVGQLRLAVSTEALERELAEAIARGHERADEAQRWLVRGAAGIGVFGLLLAFLQGFRLTRPLELLTRHAARLAGGELHHRARISSRDEIGDLAANFDYMAERLEVLLEETAAKASLEREMALAREIQEAMHPPGGAVSAGAVEIAGYLQSAAECGGDWWTYRSLSDGRVLVVVGDVTGHGLPAAMITAAARGAVEALGERELAAPCSVLEAIDKAVSNVGRHARYMTCFAAIVDPAQGRISFANAGHNFPYVCGAPGSKLRTLAAAGSPLGCAEDSGELVFDHRELELGAGDVVVFYSDGLVERVDEAGARFGERRLRRLLEQGRGESLLQLRTRILGELERFAGDTPLDDDVTIVLCRLGEVSGALPQDEVD